MQRNKKQIVKVLNGKGFKIAIATALFNDDITLKMERGAIEGLKQNGVLDNDISIFRAPGSFELPLICQKLAESRKYDAIIAIGCVIKGDTDHYYYIAGEASRAIMDLTLKFGIPIGFGIITVNNVKQAKERSEAKNNKGREAAEAVLHSLKTIKTV